MTLIRHRQRALTSVVPHKNNRKVAIPKKTPLPAPAAVPPPVIP